MNGTCLKLVYISCYSNKCYHAISEIINTLFNMVELVPVKWVGLRKDTSDYRTDSLGEKQGQNRRDGEESLNVAPTGK